MPYDGMVKCTRRLVPATVLAAFLGAIGFLAPTAGAAQAIVTFDDWVLPCAAGDGCTGGGLVGPGTAFEMLGGTDFVCAESRCLEAIWPSSSTRLGARAVGFTAPEASVFTQAQFFFPPSLFDRLMTEPSTEIPLLQIDTNIDGNFMQLKLVGGTPPKLEGRVWIGSAPVYNTQAAVTFAPGRWVTIGWHVDLGPRIADRHATLHVEGASAMVGITTPLPSGLTPVGAHALGRASYSNSGTPPGLVIDNFCVARGPIEANTGCPIGAALPPEDAGMPPPDASADSSTPLDSSTAVDSGDNADSGNAIDSGGSGSDVDTNVAVFRGAGGCTCDAGGTPSSRPPWAIAAVLLALIGRRRRIDWRIR